MIVPPVQSPAAIEARIETPQDIVSMSTRSKFFVNYLVHHEKRKLRRSIKYPKAMDLRENSLYSRQIIAEVTNEPAAQPPPYHIAILLPENSKQPEESPPPSYDKLVI